MNQEIKLVYIENPLISEEAALATGLVGWVNLVMEGYGFVGDEKFAKTQFHQEYGKSGRKIVAAAIGSMVIGTLVLSETPILVEGLTSYNVSGIVVKPNHKRQGVSSKLYAEAFKNLGIDMLVGNTKDPGAVMARTKSVEKIGMKTFYGLMEVTPQSFIGVAHSHKQYLDSYVHWKSVNPDANYVYFKDVDVLLPNIPNVNGYPQNIKTAFGPVIEAQKSVGDNKTAVMPLLSIKADLLI